MFGGLGRALGGALGGGSKLRGAMGAAGAGGAMTGGMMGGGQQRGLGPSFMDKMRGLQPQGGASPDAALPPAMQPPPVSPEQSEQMGQMAQSGMIGGAPMANPQIAGGMGPSGNFMQRMMGKGKPPQMGVKQY